MNALITGANGFIGSHFLKKYGYKFNNIALIGREKVRGYQNIFYDFEFQKLKKKIKNFDVIFNFAGQSSNNVAFNYPLRDLKINCNGLLFLIDHFIKLNKKIIVIQAGSATQTGFTNIKNSNLLFNKDEPETFYDLSKLVCEKYIALYSKLKLIKSCSLRLCNVYGNYNLNTQADRSILDRMLYKALNLENLTLYGSGNYLRDYIFIDDVVDAFYFAYKNINLLNGKNFNIGSGQGTTIKEAFNTIKDISYLYTGKKIKILKINKKISKMDKRNFVANIKLFRKKTGWKPKYSLKNGIKQTINNINYL